MLPSLTLLYFIFSYFCGQSYFLLSLLLFTHMSLTLSSFVSFLLSFSLCLFFFPFSMFYSQLQIVSLFYASCLVLLFITVLFYFPACSLSIFFFIFSIFISFSVVSSIFLSFFRFLSFPLFRCHFIFSISLYFLRFLSFLSLFISLLLPPFVSVRSAARDKRTMTRRRQWMPDLFSPLFLLYTSSFLVLGQMWIIDDDGDDSKREEMGQDNWSRFPLFSFPSYFFL